MISVKEFYQRVDEILFYLWDPIGVSNKIVCRDEYSHYSSKTAELLLLSDNSEEISEYLNSICVSTMGLSSKIEHDFKIAEILIDLKELYES